MKKMNYRLIFTGLIAVLLLAAGQAWAASGLTLHDFTPNTAAHADSVDENFGEVEKAIPVMWASIDQDILSVIYTGPMPVEINSLTNIVVPDDGILLISGSVFVYNQFNNPFDYKVNLLLDSTLPGGNQTFLSDFTAGPSAVATADPAERFTLMYTYAVAASAGTHDVSQAPETSAPGVTYNKNNLTVVFFPNLPGGIPIQNPGLPALADTATEDGS